MEIQRKAFEAYMADRYKNTVDQRVCINSDGDYMAWDMQVAWHVWQAAKAQAVPEGFVLVSKEIPDSVVDRLRYSSYHWGDGTRDYFTPVYQMIIEAQEPTND